MLWIHALAHVLVGEPASTSPEHALGDRRLALAMAPERGRRPALLEAVEMTAGRTVAREPRGLMRAIVRKRGRAPAQDRRDRVGGREAVRQGLVDPLRGDRIIG